MDMQEVFGALSRELLAASGGKMRVKEPKSSLDKWFPAIEFIDSDGKPMKMNGWGITLKYKPHGSGEAIDKNERTVVVTCPQFWYHQRPHTSQLSTDL